MRRPHRKSRTGCLQCRQRKIKCDEHKPSCNYCVRHSSRCSYNTAPFGTPIGSQFKSPEPEQSTTLVPSPLSTVPASLQYASSSGTDLSWSDLELLHNYSTSTYMTLSRRMEDNFLWQNTIPSLAYQSPFLMRGIFTISALHLASLNPGRRHELVLKASKHQHIALQELRSALMGEITKDNCNAIFASSIMLAACSMGSQQSADEDSAPEGTEQAVVPEWMNLLRGTYALLASAWAWIQEGPLGQILQQEGAILDCPVGIDDSHLVKLATLFDPPSATGPTPTPPSPELRERNTTYRAALHELRDAFLFSYAFSPGGICQSKKWSSLRYVVSVQEDYMKLLVRREPEALILLAYECVLLRREPPCWYMAGHAQHLMGIIRDNLAEEWSSWIDWPSSIVDAG